MTIEIQQEKDRKGASGSYDTDNKTISVQLNLTGTATGTKLGNIHEKIWLFSFQFNL